MDQNNKHQVDFDDGLDDEITSDEINRIFKNHLHDYIAKLEEVGFTYHDDDSDQDEREEAEAKPLNSNQEYLVIHKPSTSSGGPGEVLPFRGKLQ